VGLEDLALGSVAAVSGAGDSTAAACSTLITPRGQLKSSARPLGAAVASPLVSARVTVAPVAAAGVAPAPPISSSGATRVSVSGTTGPAAGRCAAPPALAFGACEPEPTGTGSATGMPLLPTMRSISRST
jgi:hypothetical protein